MNNILKTYNLNLTTYRFLKKSDEKKLIKYL